MDYSNCLSTFIMEHNTVIDLHYAQLTWCIENWRFAVAYPGDWITSPNFQAEKSSGIEWCLKLYPKGTIRFNSALTNKYVEGSCVNSLEGEKWMSVFLHLVKCNPQCNRLITDIHLKIVDSAKNSTYAWKSQYGYTFECNGGSHTAARTWGDAKTIESANIPPSEHKLIISCSVRYAIKDNSDSKSDRAGKELIRSMNYENASRKKLSQDMTALLQTASHFDLTIEVEGQTLHAHKCILSARSSVFQVMFQHDMSEKETSILKITDYSCQAWQMLLEYIYSGKCSVMRSNMKHDTKSDAALQSTSVAKEFLVTADCEVSDNKAAVEMHYNHAATNVGYDKGGSDTCIELLQLADKYGMTDLMNQLASQLESQICHTNVIQLIGLAYTYTLQTLLEECFHFLKLNWKKIMQSHKDDWLLLMKTFPEAVLLFFTQDGQFKI